MNKKQQVLPASPAVQAGQHVNEKFDHLALRHMLGKFATGVTIVTVHSPTGPQGMTVNSFSSVSLEPPLVQWSLGKTVGRYGVFAEAQEFAVSVLGIQHKQLAYDFASGEQAFSHDDWVFNLEKPPLVKAALATFNCSIETLHGAGDHTILVGQVNNADHHEGEPLVFFGGKFGRFAAG